MKFAQRREIALAILTRGEGLTRKAGSFCGHCVVDDTPLSDKQLDWFLTLAERAGLSEMLEDNNG